MLPIDVNDVSQLVRYSVIVQLGLPFEQRTSTCPVLLRAPPPRAAIHAARRQRRPRARHHSPRRLAPRRRGSSVCGISSGSRASGHGRNRRASARRSGDPDARRARQSSSGSGCCELAGDHGLTVSRISIRDQRSRWGSCGHDGHICLNWRLMLMPPRSATTC